MKIIDCITYCGEDLLLKIRLETLYNKVDKFVIVEANKYFDGKVKPQLFSFKLFEKSIAQGSGDLNFLETSKKYFL